MMKGWRNARERDRNTDGEFGLLIVLLIVTLCAIFGSLGCSQQGPMGPSIVKPARPNVPVGFDINIPESKITQVWAIQYPNGIKISPVEAQQKWNFTAAYGGTPNVYYGPQSPKCEYWMVGITVAPFSVASKLTFTSLDWPIFEPGEVYEWVGRFVTALPARPDQSVYGVPGCS